MKPTNNLAILTKNGKTIINKARKINNWLDCDHIKDCITTFEKSNNVKTFIESAGDIKQAILFRLNESNKDQFANDYIALGEALIDMKTLIALGNLES